MNKILMSMRVTEANNYKEYRNSIAYEYINFFESLGYLIVLVPNNSENIESYFDNDISMLVLSGGNNVNPKLYKNEDKLNDVYTKRDECERILLDIAIEKNIKVLGICKGLHFINVFMGGSLTHHIKNHVNTSHVIYSSNDILNNVKTNSYHNQAITKDDLSDSLNILAISENDIVEAVINDTEDILGIQWHPERQNKRYDKELIKQFLKGKT